MRGSDSTANPTDLKSAPSTGHSRSEIGCVVLERYRVGCNVARRGSTAANPQIWSIWWDERTRKEEGARTPAGHQRRSKDGSPFPPLGLASSAIQIVNSTISDFFSPRGDFSRPFFARFEIQEIEGHCCTSRSRTSPGTSVPARHRPSIDVCHEGKPGRRTSIVRRYLLCRKDLSHVHVCCPAWNIALGKSPVPNLVSERNCERSRNFKTIAPRRTSRLRSADDPLNRR